jgi:hypothetical protein
MEIRALDDAALADDALMRDFYELEKRSELLGRPHAPFWTSGSSWEVSAHPTAASARSCSRRTTATA